MDAAPEQFVHLHNHTIFSMLDGVAEPEAYFGACAERGWPAFAITEHGTMSSIPDAHISATEHSVKFIAGCELYYNDYEQRRRKLVESGGKVKDLLETQRGLNARMRRNRHITVLCRNMTGYGNLLKINNYAIKHGFFYKPRVWFENLAAHSEGLIVLSGCLNGPVAHEIRQDNLSGGEFRGAVEYVKMFKEAFGENYFIELQMPCLDEEVGDVKAFRTLVELAGRFGIRTVLTNDCHYLERRDFEVQKTMMAIDQGTTVDDPELFHVNSDEQFFKTREELRKTFLTKGYSDGVGLAEFEKACDGTLLVAEMCEAFDPDVSPKLPRLENDVPVLVQAAWEGFKRRGLHLDDTKYSTMDGLEVTYREQMILELRRFVEKGFASYFLITKDLVDCSHRRGWPIGPARGSAGGSLVCWLLGITSLDPIAWGLSFNRFLSPNRGGRMLQVKME